MTSDNSPKHVPKFICEKCRFKSSNKYDYNLHLLTRKHKILTNTSICDVFYCECGKEYKHRQSLYKHKQRCNFNDYENETENKIIVKEEEINYKEMLHTVIKQNTELQKTICELIPKVGNNNNSNNKFNINVFLNEDCKDALTMNQFIDKIEVSISNLMLTKNKGIEEGISNIFIENMNKLSLHERPIHCTDTKREIVYIKSEGENGEDPQWEKDKENEKLKGAIKKVEGKQFKNIKKWMDEHPGWEHDPTLQEEYINILKNCTTDVKDQKVIKKLCNQVCVSGET